MGLLSKTDLSTQFFLELPDRARDALLSKGIKRSFNKRTVLFSEGEKTGKLWVINKGSIHVYKTTPEGKEITLYVHGKGSVLGLLSVLTDDVYSVSGEAVEDIDVMVIDKRAFTEFLKEYPETALQWLKMMASRLRLCFERVTDTGTRNAQIKIAQLLLNLKTGDDDIVQFPFSQDKLSFIIGIRPETFSRVLRHFEDSGAIQRRGKRNFKILDKDKLLIFEDINLSVV
jgi:CRP-like cAMP-binding protein